MGRQTERAPDLRSQDRWSITDRHDPVNRQSAARGDDGSY
jgi:hypothetical protein